MRRRDGGCSWLRSLGRRYRRRGRRSGELETWRWAFYCCIKYRGIFEVIGDDLSVFGSTEFLKTDTLE